MITMPTMLYVEHCDVGRVLVCSLDGIAHTIREVGERTWSCSCDPSARFFRDLPRERWHERIMHR